MNSYNVVSAFYIFEEQAPWSFDVLVRCQVMLSNGPREKEGSVAQVVRHHDGGVQRGEVESGYGHVVVAFHRLDDGGALIVLIASLVSIIIFNTIASSPVFTCEDC